MPFPSSSYIPKYSTDPLYNSIKTPCFRVTVYLTCTFNISYNLKHLSLSGYRLRTYKHTELWLLWPIISSTCRQTTVQLGTFRSKIGKIHHLPLGMGSIFGPNLRGVTALPWHNNKVPVKKINLLFILFNQFSNRISSPFQLLLRSKDWIN